jgi:hypothetical protein
MKSDGIDIPSIKITASDDAPDVVVLHGYGGSKEEQLGLSWRISMLGFNTLTVDLRGHGENILPLSIKIQDDLDGLIRTIKRPSRPVVAIGHSLGGRIALLSNAEYRIGLSPALPSSFSEQTQATITMLRQYRVKEEHPAVLFDILEKLPLVDAGLGTHDALVYGSRDVPEIIQYGRKLSGTLRHAVEIENARHSDIFLLEETFAFLKKYLKPVK